MAALEVKHRIGYAPDRRNPQTVAQVGIVVGETTIGKIGVLGRQVTVSLPDGSDVTGNGLGVDGAMRSLATRLRSRDLLVGFEAGAAEERPVVFRSAGTLRRLSRDVEPPTADFEPMPAYALDVTGTAEGEATAAHDMRGAVGNLTVVYDASDSALEHPRISIHPNTTIAATVRRGIVDAAGSENF